MTIIRLCISVSILCTFIVNKSFGQSASTNSLPEFTLSTRTVEKHLRFLASDELQGRGTGLQGNLVAARYIAEQFRASGAKPAAKQGNYYQSIPFIQRFPVQQASLIYQANTYERGKELAILAGPKTQLTAPAIWVGNGWIDENQGINDYQDKEVEGKIIVVSSGIPGESSIGNTLLSSTQKRRWAEERGALALIEIHQLSAPWQMVSRFFSNNRLEVDPSYDPAQPPAAATLVHAWIHDPEELLINALKDGASPELTIESSGRKIERLFSHNVVGVIEGSDPILKDEYILLSAHYDHLGTNSSVDPTSSADSIFNGARDNGIGVTALLCAAEAFGKANPKRSILLIAYTAEEKGLLGSKYYAENPLIPLQQTIFNLNSDGAGYTDTTAVSILGFNRVGAAEEMQQACDTFDLNIIVDPAPEQNLFDRSDNVSLAQKGVPAPTFSPGFSNFNQELFKYYHKVADEVDNLNWTYLTRFAQAFTYSARLIANKTDKPIWVEGDKYESAGKELYNR